MKATEHPAVAATQAAAFSSAPVSGWTREALMTATENGFLVFRHYLGHAWKPRKNFQNPFREPQETPSFNVYLVDGTREWAYHDFATGDKGSCLDLVMQLHHLSFAEALARIAQDLHLSTEAPATVVRKDPAAAVASAKRVATDPPNAITYRTGWLDDERAYWEQYGISLPLLEQYGVRAVEEYQGQSAKGDGYSVKSRPHQRIYAYATDQTSVKLYKPEAPKGRKFQWLNGAPTDFLFGLEELPASGSLVLIAAGEKDVMTLAAHGYAAITLASETAVLTADIVRRLSRFGRILLCYDLDETGRTQAARWAQEHQLGWVELPAALAALGGKDVSDLYRAIKQGQLPPDAFEQALQQPHEPIALREAPPLATRPDRLKPLTHLSELLSMQGQLRTRTEGEIVFNPALFWHDEEPVIWPRTINMIQGQYGVHKSRLAELFATILLAVGPPTFDTLGLSFRPLAGESYKLCYVDTERNTSDQFPYALQSIKERAGFARGVHPTSFEYTSLINVPRGERFAALRDFLVHIRASFSGHIFTVLDVVPDCVRNFNDVNDSLELVDLLNEVINEQNITFLVLIHENPGGAKARGHLGTELGNKASTILQIAYLKSDEAPRRLIELSYLKRRYGTPDFTAYAEYDVESKGLIRAEPTTRDLAHKQRPQKAPLDEVLSLLPELLREPLPAGELEKQLGERLGVSARTIHDRLKDCLPDGASGLIDQLGELCTLTKQERGKEKFYALVPVQNSAVRPLPNA